MTHHETPAATPEHFWDDRYGQSARIWSGNPNAVLVTEATDLTPGTALDLGCGEGADSIWLAGRGWRVTGVDISEVAIGRATAHAGAAGVADRTSWLRANLATGFPAGRFDLVSAHFLQSPVELPRVQILLQAASAVAVGGTLLVVGHAEFPRWSTHHESHVHLETADEVVASLDLAPAAWRVVTAESRERTVTAPDGSPAVLVDSVVRAERVAD
jgi:SAM-dependent methyltransferase